MPYRFKLIDDAPVEVAPGHFETRVCIEKYHLETYKRDVFDKDGKKIGQEDVATPYEIVDCGFGETLYTTSDDKAAIKAEFLKVKQTLLDRLAQYEESFKPRMSNNKITEADLA